MSVPNKFKQLPHYVLRKLRHIQYTKLLSQGVSLVKLKIHGFPMLINIHDQVLGRHFYLYRDYEKFESDLLEKLLNPQMIVFDIGANIGFYSIIAARKAHLGKVIAFEPDPTNFEVLQKNIALNQLQNVVAKQFAITDNNGDIHLYLSDLNFGDHRVFKPQDDSVLNNGKQRASITVQAITIDSFVTETGFMPDLIKMDIQGSEIPALVGMQNTLERIKPILFCEYWPNGLKQNNNNPIQFLEMLLNMGYLLYEIDESNKQLVKLTDIHLTTEKLNNPIAGFDAHINLISIHNTKIVDELKPLLVKT